MATLHVLPVPGSSATAPAQSMPSLDEPAAGEVQAPPPSQSLFDLEMSLQTLADSVECVPPEREKEFLEDFRRVLTQVREKRDRVAAFLSYCEAMAEASSKEISRLQQRKESFLKIAARVEGYVETILRELGRDSKGKWAKLEGNTSSFTLRNLPPSTLITDEAAVPTEFKSVTITLPAPMWERVIDSLDMEMAEEVLNAVKKPQSSVSKTLVKEAIEAHVPTWKAQLKDKPSVFCPEVPGAAIAAGGTKLVRG